MNRILVIGLDGASYHLVERWRSDLPNLNRLVERGVSGILHSVLPPRSIPAWYCFATGMNPAKLGVFGFSQRRPGTYDYTFANSTYCQAPMFWEWAGDYGIRSGVVLVPGTFPPRSVNGFLVSGWPAPDNRGKLTYTHPASLGREIDGFLGEPLEFVSPQELGPGHDEAVFSELERILEMHTSVAEHLLAKQDWRIGVVVLTPLDRASHQFWRHMDREHPDHEPQLANQFGSALKMLYMDHDACLGRLLSMLDDSDHVFVVSDHGFGPAYRSFYINEWLRQEGYLVLKEGASTGQRSWTTKLVGRLAAPLFRLNASSQAFRRLAEPFKKRLLTNFVRDQYVQMKERGKVRINHAPIDWNRTRAYCPDEACLYINLAGRDPLGIVSPGEDASNLLEEIVTGLRAIVDPSTGAPIGIEAYRKEEIYSGPYLEDAPELTLVVNGFRTLVMAELGSNSLFDRDTDWSGTHDLDGLFIAAGPSVRQGARLDPSLLDIAPTILHLAGLPLPSESDGTVMLQAFAEASDARQRPIRGQPMRSKISTDHQLVPEEEAAVEAQLRRLGYIE